MPPMIHGKMVYSFEKPMWHSITEPSLIEMSAEEILDSRFEGGISIDLRPAIVHLNGVDVETGDFAIVRSPSSGDNLGEIVFGYCSDRFHPLQPREIARAFDENVLQPAETMAFLGKGEKMFISWKMPSFDVTVGDTVDMFGIVTSGFDTLKGTSLITAIYRPVCANTHAMAEGWAKANTDKSTGKGNIWKGKAVNKNLLRDLGYWMAHVQQNALREGEILKNFFGILAKTPVKSDVEAQDIILEAFPNQENVSSYYPKELRGAKNEVTLDFNQRQDLIRVGVFDLFSGAGTQITPDYWGLFNATTEYFCHVQPSKRPIAESVMFGGRQKHTMQMVNTLARRAK